MENFNHTLFFWFNAPEHPNTLLLTVATFFAEYVIWVIPTSAGMKIGRAHV